MFQWIESVNISTTMEGGYADLFYAYMRDVIVLILFIAISSILAITLFYILLPSPTTLRVSAVLTIITLTTAFLWVALTIATVLHPYLHSQASFLLLLSQILSAASTLSAFLLAPLAYFYEDTLDADNSLARRLIDAALSWAFFAVSTYGAAAMLQSLWDNKLPFACRYFSLITSQQIPGLFIIAICTPLGIRFIARTFIDSIRPVTWSPNRLNDLLLAQELDAASRSYHMYSNIFRLKQTTKIFPQFHSLLVSSLLLNFLIGTLLLEMFLLYFALVYRLCFRITQIISFHVQFSFPSFFNIEFVHSQHHLWHPYMYALKRVFRTALITFVYPNAILDFVLFL